MSPFRLGPDRAERRDRHRDRDDEGVVRIANAQIRRART
jgi:hypothetical protein